MTWTNPTTQKRQGRSVKRMVFELFYDSPPGIKYRQVEIYHACGIINCLNPQHLDARIVGK